MHNPLPKPLRNQLDRTVQQAREIAESAAHAALDYLGVGEAAAPAHLSDEQRSLRVRLRAHGRQLGDGRREDGCPGKTLETWLRDHCFTQHCKRFHHRPFIWHIWDGLRDGFSALVNYHKLDNAGLQRLIYTYLGDWIRAQEMAQGQGTDGAAERLAAAQSLKRRLEAILQGEAPLDIFVRWKPLHRQPIGWDPDLNDGMRLNIRPFMQVQDVKKKGAGVLRDKPNIHWKKDRGTDVPSAPWYHLGPDYGEKEGARINDHHLSLSKKRQARECQPEQDRAGQSCNRPESV